MPDQATVLTAVAARLQNNLLLPDSRCYLTMEPLSGAGTPAGGDFWVTVSPGDSDFEWQAGGGSDEVKENATCIVTGYTRIRLDPTARDTQALLNLQRGLMPIKQKILAAMLSQDTPLADSQGNPLLTDYIIALSSNRAAHDIDKGIGWISVIFATPFLWDLSNVL